MWGPICLEPWFFTHMYTQWGKGRQAKGQNIHSQRKYFLFKNILILFLKLILILFLKQIDGRLRDVSTRNIRKKNWCVLGRMDGRLLSWNFKWYIVDQPTLLSYFAFIIMIIIITIIFIVIITTLTILMITWSDGMPVDVLPPALHALVKQLLHYVHQDLEMTMTMTIFIYNIYNKSTKTLQEAAWLLFWTNKNRHITPHYSTK